MNVLTPTSLSIAAWAAALSLPLDPAGNSAREHRGIQRHALG